MKTFSPKCESAGRVAKQGQTFAHLRYITRTSAARTVIRERLNHSTDLQQSQVAEREAQKRRGRVCERFIVALPIEASLEQRTQLAQAFAEQLTKGKAGYVLAIHDKAGNDQRNPHFHLVAFDKHEKSGERGRPRSIIGMARKNAVETTAKQWADIHNRKMTEWGFGIESTITHLSFQDRGINRVPEIHEGASSRAMLKRGAMPSSKREWKHIDAGRTRAEANIAIRQINQLNEEIENEPGNRLGSKNRRNKESVNCSSPPFGKDCQRGRAIALGNIGTKESPVSLRKEPGRDQQPPWIAGERPGSPTSASRASLRRKSQRLSSNICERPFEPSVRRRRVRRVFLELIFLRDTLRARFATVGRAHRNLPNASSLKRTNQIKKKSRLLQAPRS
ncbi:MobA/MobL family protein [Roseovarius sp. THAF8]|uniref:MobA/MobL family protein n=1 Tax=Roseovarius sp. THAF8 TaxID=2587846 RepID=UPI001562ACE4|nr:MobA/MobL family protein [Roseovarius sp. THAF8]